VVLAGGRSRCRAAARGERRVENRADHSAAAISEENQTRRRGQGFSLKSQKKSGISGRKRIKLLGLTQQVAAAG